MTENYEDLRAQIGVVLSAFSAEAAYLGPAARADAVLAVVTPELERRDADLALAEERIAKTRQALRLDEKWSVQHGALAVRSERDRAVAERNALRAQLAEARQRFTDTWRALDVEDKGGNAGFVEGALAARGLLQHVLDGLGWTVSESVPATPDSLVRHTNHGCNPVPAMDLPEVEAALAGEWSVDDLALDRTNFVWRRDPEGWRPVRNLRGVAYRDAALEQAAGPLLRLLIVPEATDDFGAVPIAVADALRAEAALENQARADAFDDVPHDDCTDPPRLCCSDAGCPEHGDHDYDEDEEDDGEQVDWPADVIEGAVAPPAAASADTTPRVWSGPDPEEDRKLLIEAVRYVLHSGNARATALQRNLRVGFAKALRLTDLLEGWGIVSSRPDKNTERIVLAPSAAVDDIVAAISEVLPNTEQEAER